MRASLDEALASAVDDAFYVHSYGEVPPGFTPASHYATLGWRQGYDPNPWFSTESYLAENPDVLEADFVPLFHFLEFGVAEGRVCKPSRHAEAYLIRHAVSAPEETVNEGTTQEVATQEVTTQDESLEYEKSVIRNEFDRDYYLAVNPDVAQSRFDPLSHFVEFGWRERRDPNAFFSTSDYLEENADVASAGVNPFYHYVAAGRGEGRSPKASLGFRYYVLLNQLPLDKRMAAGLQIPSWRLGSRIQLVHALSSLSRSKRQSLYVSVSHDNFTENVGGVQLCLQREADAFAERGFDHLHFFPGRMFLVTDHDDEDPATGILINGESAGHFRASTVAEVLRSTFDTTVEWPQRGFAIHSLLGHNVKSLTAILKSLRIQDGYFWLHDYSSISSGLQLLRNDVEFCGAPPPDSTACQVCIYGERRRLQLADHELFFRNFDLTVLAPSQTALTTWKNGTALDARGGERVHPHCRLIPRPPRQQGETAAARPLRVAFLGQPAVHKGWPVFRDLILRYAGDRRFEFFHLGMHEQPRLPLRFAEVRVNAGDPAAMTKKIEELQIDVVIIWSLWPETFCFTAYEAVAGGAVVVAPAGSGNVAHMVRETGKGVVLADEGALWELFESGVAESLARSKRRVEHFSLELSTMTADLIGDRE